MSTKTNFKRVALVAVAALGLGVLTSVAPANAGVALADIVITPADAGTLAAAGVCVVDPKAQANVLVPPLTSRIGLSTGTVVQSGTSLTFTSTLNAAATLTISGPAKWTAVSDSVKVLADPSTPDFTFDATATKLTAAAAPLVLPEAVTATLTTTGVGAVTVTAASAAGGIDVIGITAVASCSSATTFAAANTLANLTNAANKGNAADGIDSVLTADRAYGSHVYLNLNLLNAYKGPIADGVVTATATNGALISFDPLVLPGIASQAFVLGGSTNLDLSISQDKVTNPGKALTTTVTVAFNGATVATKTVTLLGEAASIEISKVTVGSTEGTTGSFNWVTKDNAGNLVNSPAFAGITSAATGRVNGSIVGETKATLANFVAATPTVLGTGTFACIGASTTSSGSDETVIGFVTSALTVVKSAPFKATCGSNTANTFTASLDKAVYAAGEIATLTITAKDANGGMVSDLAANGVLPLTGISLGGMEPIGVVGLAADKYVSGVLTYKFRVLNITSNEQSFVGQALVTASTDLTPKILQYKVVAGGSGVSNADVLKAIVSLIASINKQIAALQKALLKMK